MKRLTTKEEHDLAVLYSNLLKGAIDSKNKNSVASLIDKHYETNLNSAFLPLRVSIDIANTPLSYAIEKGTAEIVEVICKNMTPAEIAATDKNGFTYLHLATLNRSNPSIVDALCKHMTSEQIASQSVSGLTALTIAMLNKDNGIFGALCKHMTSKQISDHGDDISTILEYARHLGNPEIVAIIEKVPNTTVSSQGEYAQYTTTDENIDVTGDSHYIIHTSHE